MPTGGIPETGPTLRIGIGDDQAAGDTSAVVAEVVDALTSVQVVLLALPGRAVDDFLAEHAAAIDATLVIDATNRVGSTVINASPRIMEVAPHARYARAFDGVLPLWLSLVQARGGNRNLAFRILEK